MCSAPKRHSPLTVTHYAGSHGDLALPTGSRTHRGYTPASSRGIEPNVDAHDAHPRDWNKETATLVCGIFCRGDPRNVQPLSIEASMHPIRSDFNLPMLRRQLEEILAMVKADHIGSAFISRADEEAATPVRGNDPIAAEPQVALAEQRLESLTAGAPAPSEVTHHDARDDLYDDALVVVTEFGQASAAILQMWLSIDYSRATKLLSEFQADGLVSSKGRVRHKAYSLRRSEA